MMTTLDFARALVEALPTIFIFVWAYCHIARLERRIEDIAQYSERQINHLWSAQQETLKALKLLLKAVEDDGTEDVEEEHVNQ